MTSTGLHMNGSRFFHGHELTISKHGYTPLFMMNMVIFEMNACIDLPRSLKLSLKDQVPDGRECSFP